MTLPTLDFLAILPQLIVVVAALAILLADVLVRAERARRLLLPAGTLAALLLAVAAVVWLALDLDNARAFQDMAVADGLALGFDLVLLTVAVLGVLLAWHVVPRVSRHGGSYYALLLLALAGMMTMGAGLDLLVIFLALEILSLALYILVGFDQQQARGAEASLKYFLLGAFASGFFLYGVALVYGATGTTDLGRIAVAAAGASDLALLYGGTALLIVGFGFKVALIPFHMWAPDAYQGAPTSVTAFMSVAAKAAGFAALIRVFLIALPASEQVWGWALAVLAALTMTLANLAALRQSSVKRMLAYSSVAHAGYIAVALVPGSGEGASAALFYLFAYAFMTVGAFAVLLAVERLGDNDVAQAQLTGLGSRRPGLAAAMAIFMFSLAGIPPLAGFVAKFYVFSAAAAAGWIWLVVVAVINSVVAAYYYLRITVQMFFAEPEAGGSGTGAGQDAKGDLADGTALASSRSAIAVAMGLAVVGTLLMGIWPFPWADWIARAVGNALGL